MADVTINKFRASVVRDGSKPSSPGFIVSEGQDPVNPPGTNNYVPYSGATANVELGEYGVEAGFITLDTTPTNTPTDQGTIFWDADDETVDIVLNGYTMKIGEDLFYPVKNQTGSTIAKGVAVRFNGTVGASGRLLIAPFIADGSVASSRFMGVTAEEILNGEDGKVLYFGRVRGINTNAFNEGDILYASTTVAGGYQTAIPVAPNNIVQVAAVVTKSATVGTIFVRPTLGSNINTDEGVKITSVADKNLLQYQSGTSLWENKSLAQVLGGTSAQFVKGDGSLDSTSYGTGTVTSVGLSSATSGVTIGSTPVTTSGTITLAIATASGSQNGLLSSTDWTTFNGKQNALTNPVTGTGTTNYLPKFTGASTIGNSLFTDNGTNGGFGGANYSSGTDVRSFNISAPLYAGLGFWANNVYVADIFGYTVSGNIIISADPTNTLTDSRVILSTDGTQRFAVFSNGNVSIANSPTDNGAKLQVSGTARISGNLTLETSSLILGLGNGGSNEAVYFNYNSNAASRSWRIIKDWTAFGDFQIQQSTTQTGTTYADILRFSPTGAATFDTTSSINAVFNSTNASGGYIAFRRSATNIGYLGNSAQLGIGVNNALELRADNNLYLTTTSGTLSMLSTGNVGIATNTPNGKLTIKAEVSNTPSLVFKNEIGGPSSAISNFVSAAQTFTIFGTNVYVNSTANLSRFDTSKESCAILFDEGLFRILTGTTGGNPSTRMTVTSVGIVDIAGPLVVRGTLPADQTDAAVIDHFSNTMRIFSYGAAGVTGDFQFRTAAGGAGSNLVSTINGTTGAYTAVSDINKKKDFEESTIGLNAILGLKPTLYRMKSETNTQKHLGFIAQEVRQYIPNAYVENGEFIGINEMPIIAALTKAIQELKQEIDTLKN